MLCISATLPPSTVSYLMSVEEVIVDQIPLQMVVKYCQFQLIDDRLVTEI